MRSATQRALSHLVSSDERSVLKGWLECLSAAEARISPQEAQAQGKDFLQALGKAVADGNISDIRGSDFADVRDLLAGFSRSRALQGFSPSETATFVFSLKQALFERIRSTTSDAKLMADSLWALNLLLDQLGLFTIETFQKTRDELIERQRQEIEELSTPVVKLWDGIVALPLIGTLDSGRTQVVMQNLLETIVQTGAEIAILDIPACRLSTRWSPSTC